MNVRSEGSGESASSVPSLLDNTIKNNIGICHEGEGWIEKSVPRIAVWHAPIQEFSSGGVQVSLTKNL